MVISTVNRYRDNNIGKFMFRNISIIINIFTGCFSPFTFTNSTTFKTLRRYKVIYLEIDKIFEKLLKYTSQLMCIDYYLKAMYMQNSQLSCLQS